MIYIGNAFSLQMLDLKEKSLVEISPVSKEDLKEKIKQQGFVSIVGHTDTAQVLSSDLDLNIEANRISLNLKQEDILFVAQLTGGRLPEGSTILPEGFNFTFLEVRLI